jgi:hypothetical protein
VTVPVVSHILSLERETHWSDLLAVLLETDPASMSQLLDLGDRPEGLRVRRERQAQGRDRLDLLIELDGHPHAIVEIKVLAGLGPTQLDRYRDAFPDLPCYLVVHPEGLTVDTTGATAWQKVSWERLLAAFSRSENSWVAETARAWQAHLDHAVPRVEARTRWNDIPAGQDLGLAMQTRMSWVFGRLQPPPGITHDLVVSAAGRSSVVRMYRPAAPDYQIIAETEEKLPVQEYPRGHEQSPKTPRGPSVKGCLGQNNVHTSAGFDWDYLLSLWPLMAEARQDWVTTSARPRAPHDRANWEAMVAKGGPKYLGIGFGEKQAQQNGSPILGARFQLPADISLGRVVDEMQHTARLVTRMAKQPQPNGSRYE